MSTDHLARARDYLARGEEFYARAADEIIAANRDGLTQAAIGKALGRSQGWVGDLIRWRRDYRDTDNAPASPWGGEDANEKEVSIDRKLRPALAALGYVITDADTLNRRLFDECSPDEFESQVAIQALNVQRCRDRLDTDRRVLAFLRAKERELGRPVTAGEFAEEIAAMVGESQEQAA